MKNINILDYPEIIEKINGIINNKGVAEIKNEQRFYEGRKISDAIVVVEITRRLRASEDR